MARRKGELSPAAIDRGWPHQIAILATSCEGKNELLHQEFCRGLSLCVRGHSVVWGDEWYIVKCFALREDAEAFKRQFGGEWFDPSERGRGSKWHTWYRGRSGKTA